MEADKQKMNMDCPTNPDICFESVLSCAEKGKKILDAHICASTVNQIFLIFPDDTPELLGAAYRHLDRLMEEADHTTILTSVALDLLEKHTSKPYELVKLTEEEMNCVLRFASMVQIDLPSVKMISLTMPKSQRGELLPGYKDVSMDVAVARGLYGIFGEYR